MEIWNRKTNMPFFPNMVLANTQQPNSPDISNTPTAKVSWYKPTPHQPSPAQVFPDSALPAEQPGGGFSHGKKRLGCFCV